MADVAKLDEGRLADYLRGKLEGFSGTLRAEKFADGQSNPTFKISDGHSSWVLRRKPPGELLASAHAVDREFRVLQALYGSDVPVAKPYLLCEDSDVIGSMFYVMEYVDGRILWDSALAECDKADRAPMYDEMNRVLAALHLVDYKAAGLEDFGKPGGYFARQLNRWSKQYRASETEKIDEMDSLIAWLEQNIPAEDGQVSLLHGDYRLDNMIFHPRENRVIAVLDWELSTLGHPVADLAYQCMQLRLPPMGAIKGLGGLDRDQLGIPSEEAYVAAYCRRRGLTEIPHWNTWVAFCLFRLAAIIQGVYKRSLDGNASSTRAKEMGASVQPLAAAGLALIA